MLGMTLSSVIVHHLLAVAMVGGNQGLPSGREQGLLDSSQALIKGLHGGDGGLEHSGMPHHVAVGEVDHDTVESPLFNRLHQFVGDLAGTHFRLQVVGGHIRGGNQSPLFPGKYFLSAAAEKKRHVGVFFSFCDAQLGHSLLGQHLPKAVADQLRRKRNRAVELTAVVAGADQAELRFLPAIKVVEVVTCQRFGQLTGSVGPEVHEQDRISVGYGSRCAHLGGLYKLIVFAPVISCLQAVLGGAGGKRGCAGQ